MVIEKKKQELDEIKESVDDKKEETKEEVKERFEIKDMATQTEPIIIDNKTGQPYNLLTALCQLLNDVSELKKLVG